MVLSLVIPAMMKFEKSSRNKNGGVTNFTDEDFKRMSTHALNSLQEAEKSSISVRGESCESSTDVDEGLVKGKQSSKSMTSLDKSVCTTFMQPGTESVTSPQPPPLLPKSRSGIVGGRPISLHRPISRIDSRTSSRPASMMAIVDEKSPT
ncbi:hypothetical protein BCR33DRAFT_219421 [Rhizoclosmatium globosum]|uniref:Uncharacterized protein n=1 Tax=Rhizoclosmatium globosum TaxID=329046 RepID=A0A1Y2CBM6_9FUNG|nr:hypothetical protein BCR33DRAFT_219421 [Rhizoclosmatium globosum]|eukprot:ORY44336.1 hypothetical protein BCR33DRAFT_219421 [Rhizoclosmatium globosum]